MKEKKEKQNSSKLGRDNDDISPNKKILAIDFVLVRGLVRLRVEPR